MFAQEVQKKIVSDIFGYNFNEIKYFDQEPKIKAIMSNL